MKTLVISSFHPFISRNIFQSGFLEKIRAGFDRIVIVVPKEKKEYFEKNFSSPNTLVEGVKTGGGTGTFLGLAFKRVARFLLQSDSAVIQQKRKAHFEKKAFFYYFIFSPIHLLGKSSWARRIFRSLDKIFTPKNIYIDLLRKYSPKIVFATDVQNENDVILLRDAKSLGITAFAMVRSWDNLTVHGYLREVPDTLLVGSHLQKIRAITLHDMSADKILIVGVPHFDKYLKSPKVSKKEFLERMNFNENKKVIMYAPIGDRYLLKNDIDELVMRTLSDLSEQTIVRFPPTDPVKIDCFKKPDHMHYDVPSAYDRKLDGFQEISKEDDENLFHELAFSDVVITGPSTIALEATLFNKPVVIIDFYPDNRPYLERVTYDFDHLKDILSTGAFYRVQRFADLVPTVRSILSGVDTRQKDRYKVIDQQFSGLAGKSVDRLAEVILRFLSENRS